MSTAPPELTALTCASCGGALLMAVGHTSPHCLFCGSEQVSPLPPVEGIEMPQTYLPFSIGEEEARASFRVFARSSVFYPSDLRDVSLELKPVLIPAWIWSGDLESYYAALVPAGTKSGKRPETGEDSTHFDGALVLSSSTLTRAELQKIEPFQPEVRAGFDPAQVEIPFEPGLLTRSVARREGEDCLKALHQAELKRMTGAVELRLTAIVKNLTGQPLLLPVYLGAYRRGEHYYRVVVNGQTAKLTGNAPISFWRVLFAALILLTVMTIALWVHSKL